MADFISNLVRKAAGLMLTTGPEQPLIPRSQIASGPPTAVKQRHQDDTSESPPAVSDDGLRRPVATTEDAAEPDETEYPEPGSASSIAGFKSSTHKVQTTSGSAKESVDYRARVPELVPSEQDSVSPIIRPEAQVEQESKSPKMMRDTLDPLMSSDKNRSAQHSTIAPTVSFESVSQVSPNVPDSGRGSIHSRTEMSELDTPEPALSSILHKPKTQVQQESLKPTAGSHDGHVVAGRRSEAFKPSFVPWQVQDVSQKTKVGDDTVVAVEPPTEASNQTEIRKLTTSTRNAFSTQPYRHGQVDTTQTSQNKEDVRVSIGRIEIKAARKAQRSMNPPVQGFDDYLMMRLYLDRHYF